MNMVVDIVDVQTMTTSISHWQSPSGMLEIRISDQSVLSIKKSSTKKEQIAHDPFTQRVIAQLAEYMKGKREVFDLPLRMEGTVFQKAVWKALLKIPAGETRTYGQLASMIGKPTAARAVGQALNKNPVCIVVPCHRVISSDGLGGYAYGKGMKEWLLNHERRM
jgi:methylated-DNA-[protein]-cysteine S-methyltransferase